MPYHVGKSDSCPASRPHAVIKDSDGEVMGCHASVEDAQRQIAAIHASEGSAVETVELADDDAAFHLPGKHNQKTHGHNTGPKYDRSKPSKMANEVDLAVTSPVAITGGYETNMAGMVGTPWEGIIALEGVETGDGRQFAENAITWVDPTTATVPFRRNIEDSHGGVVTTKAVLVGRIDEMWRDPDNPMMIRARGIFDDQGEHGAEALRLVRDGFLSGVSVDPDDIKDADVELVFPAVDENAPEEEQLMAMFANPELTIYHAGRLRGATLVDIPAFVEAKIWLTDQTPTAPETEVISSGHFGALSDRPWNGAVHEARLSQRLNVHTARTAFAHVLTGDVNLRTATRFLHHEVTGEGSVGHANLAACAAGIRAINAGRATTLGEAERRLAYDHMAQHLRAAGLVAPPYEGGQVLLASSVLDGLERPPSEWFSDPQLGEVTPLTVTDEGRVFGHGAVWGTCHTSFGGACVTPPVEGDHAYFRVGEVVCADGARVAVGSITLGTGHASTRGLTPSQAAEHYDNTGTVVALVASGEDAHGIWVAGAVRHGTPPSRIAELQAAALSGDWRRIGGNLRLVAFLAVNRPGFPVPRTATFVARQQQLSLVAAGVVTQDMRRVDRDVHRATMLRLARSIGRGPEARMSELRQRVRGE